MTRMLTVLLLALILTACQSAPEPGPSPKTGNVLPYTNYPTRPEEGQVALI